ncbi:MAG TPA: glycerol-3-phosphate 1-O-acyltransferase PlsY [Candidatus Hydrogenedentes bacterium]|nr:glycerol-3-phosphate 1-O-acyltransferase PlsY [Candidatus Hydrogenedentota bacterium]
MNLLLTLTALLLSYALGSIPTGLWLGLWLRKIDIREHGSKNIGATNTMRVLGKKLGAIALAGDVAKGIVPVVLLARLGTWEHLPLACGLAAILGHTFSLFLKFNGGKGVATSTGVFLALAPIPMLAGAVVFAIVVAATRMVSAGSVSGAAAVCLAAFLAPLSVPVRVVAVAVAALVMVKHRSNIKRILRGEENKI